MTQQERHTGETDTQEANSHQRLAIPKTDDPGTGAVPGMPNLDARIVTGVFEREDAANRAVRELHNAGFAEDTVVIAAQPAGTAPAISASETHAGSGLRIGAITGAVVGLIIGVGVVALPSTPDLPPVGPVLLTLAAALVGAALGALIGSFTGLGQQTQHAEMIEAVTRAGGTTVTVRTSDAAERDQASEVLRNAGAQAVSDYQEAL